MQKRIFSRGGSFQWIAGKAYKKSSLSTPSSSFCHKPKEKRKIFSSWSVTISISRSSSGYKNISTLNLSKLPRNRSLSTGLLPISCLRPLPSLFPDGLYPRKHGVLNNTDIRKTGSTFNAPVFKQNGYWTAGVVKSFTTPKATTETLPGTKTCASKTTNLRSSANAFEDRG